MRSDTDDRQAVGKAGDNTLPLYDQVIALHEKQGGHTSASLLLLEQAFQQQHCFLALDELVRHWIMQLNVEAQAPQAVSELLRLQRVLQQYQQDYGAAAPITLANLHFWLAQHYHQQLAQSHARATQGIPAWLDSPLHAQHSVPPYGADAHGVRALVWLYCARELLLCPDKLQQTVAVYEGATVDVYLQTVFNQVDMGLEAVISFMEDTFTRVIAEQAVPAHVPLTHVPFNTLSPNIVQRAQHDATHYMQQLNLPTPHR